MSTEANSEAAEVADVDATTALEQLVLEDAKLAETADAIAERRAQIRAALAKHFDVGTHELAGRKVIVSQPERLDAKALERDFPADAYPQLYKRTLDTKSVRDNIAAVVLREQYTQAGGKQVTLR